MIVFPFEAAAAEPEGGLDLSLMLPLLLLVGLGFFMWFNSKKARARQAQVREGMRVGTEVMTNSGIYGVIVAVDKEKNTTTLEVSPGNTIRVHSAAIATVIEPTPADDTNENEIENPGDEQPRL